MKIPPEIMLEIALRQLDDLGFKFSEQTTYVVESEHLCPNCKFRGTITHVEPHMKHCCECGCRLIFKDDLK